MKSKILVYITAIVAVAMFANLTVMPALAKQGVKPKAHEVQITVRFYYPPYNLWPNTGPFCITDKDLNVIWGGNSNEFYSDSNAMVIIKKSGLFKFGITYKVWWGQPTGASDDYWLADFTVDRNGSAQLTVYAPTF